SEGIDQTRGWFYTMLVISTFLMGKSSYKSCLVNELILDAKGKKMSKSVGNTVDPMEIMRTTGADPLRWYMLTCSPVWGTTRFDIAGVKEAQRKILATLENTYNFYTLYANLDGYTPADEGPQELDLLDKWILSRLQSVTERVTADVNDLHLTRAAKTVGTFFMDDVSNWYVRLSRRRFWKGEMTPDKRAAFATLYKVLESSALMLAPFIPFTAEEIYRGLVVHQDADASVHLKDFPTLDKSQIDLELEKAMAAAQAVVGLGRSLRQESGLKTRQPLGQLLIHANDDRASLVMADPLLQDYICEELNIKKVGTVADPREVATLSAKANFRALGPRFGKQAPAAAKVITAMTAEQVLELREHGRVNLTLADDSLEFTFEEVMVIEEGVAPFVASGNNGLIVALDTTLTPELKEEGLCRELINKIQNLRKKSGLEVSDRIKLSIEGPEAVLTTVSRFEERISGETLAVTVAAKGELAYKDSFEIEEQDITIALDRA
ncbi:MAG: isoleucyl-tRNA synthetase, partial [Candidatus Krumholzibacteriia bacterium]